MQRVELCAMSSHIPIVGLVRMEWELTSIQNPLGLYHDNHLMYHSPRIAKSNVL
jgi:hypothetical protein